MQLTVGVFAETCRSGPARPPDCSSRVVGSGGAWP